MFLFTDCRAFLGRLAWNLSSLPTPSSKRRFLASLSASLSSCAFRANSFHRASARAVSDYLQFLTCRKARRKAEGNGFALILLNACRSGFLQSFFANISSGCALKQESACFRISSFWLCRFTLSFHFPNHRSNDPRDRSMSFLQAAFFLSYKALFLARVAKARLGIRRNSRSKMLRPANKRFCLSILSISLSLPFTRESSFHSSNAVARL